MQGIGEGADAEDDRKKAITRGRRYITLGIKRKTHAANHMLPIGKKGDRTIEGEEGVQLPEGSVE